MRISQYLKEKGVILLTQRKGFLLEVTNSRERLNFGAFQSSIRVRTLGHIYITYTYFFPNAANEEEEKQRKEVQERTNPGPKEERMDISESLLFHFYV